MASSSYKGSCKCNGIQILLQGEPSFVGLCHCRNCRKSTSSAFSVNAIYTDSALSIEQGKPKEFEVRGGSGNPAFVHFCENCSTTLFTTTPLRPEIRVIKVGVLDGDAMDKWIPTVETFTSRKPGWVQSVNGAAQCEEAFKPPQQS